MTSRWRKNADALARLVRNHEGPLTRELVRKPGRFGLGQVPSRLAPDAVAHAVCGFCSTGCGLKLHLRDGEACNVTPDPDYPVNRGMACPKGWEVLAPLDAEGTPFEYLEQAVRLVQPAAQTCIAIHIGKLSLPIKWGGWCSR